MTGLPAKYSWLEAPAMAPLPKMVSTAITLFGTRETAGPGNTPAIMDWARECGLDYDADQTPWCGLFMAVVAKRAGKPVPAKPLWALNWGRFGEDGAQPELGDVLVFVRPGGGHVGLYVAEDQSSFHVLGGNQSDSVCITRIAKTRLYTVRQPKYTVKPASARTYLVSETGSLSSNEQ